MGLLLDDIRVLAQAANYAMVTTKNSDGSVQSQPLWVDADDDHVIINTETGRHRFRNVQRDPNVTVTIVETGGWYRWAEVRGTVVETITGPEARAHIDALSQKYVGVPYGRPVETERVILKIKPNRQISFPPQ